ncbi:BglII/BstYI family type II restriction endonuclease [Burkholderia pseudomallei]|uniref:BglII/BstYI family type II restriction endonuclease n=1 Tax=Burkholderia pseudomallei TaxID=28450 RepID=UPI0003C0B0B6|nr:BglII/BstYI family type II restriction endonuclease [Burkholderia pseudomallei]AGZ26797.1 restriction endonuclease BglII family protein [Burkholderia pseudomallei NCTC 13179]KGW82060.1 restriction endonuclease BglII family protein [Burkholderia pseudomallei MSHR456]
MFETATYNDPLVLDPFIRARWAFLETSSAAAVLRSVCPFEWADITNVLRNFQLNPVRWLRAGGNRGDVAQEIDDMFTQRGWREMRLDLVTQGILVTRGGQIVDQLPPMRQEGYLVDNFKGRVVLDVEWNAKDGNLDRDMSAYRSWHEAGVISAAVLITQDRAALKPLAEHLWGEYQNTLRPERRSPRLPIDLNTSTTTNLEKAALRVRRGVMGTCPLLVVAAIPNTWNGRPYTAI